MPKKALFGLVLIAAVLSTGCFTHRYSTSPEAVQGSEVYKKWHNHFLFGLISNDEDVDIKELCPSGNFYIEDKQTFVNQLLGGLTLGIWIPTTVIVRCADGSSQAEFQIDEKLARAIVTDPLFIELISDLYPERLAEVQIALRQLEPTPERASR